jgi:hypothetical protein
MGQALAIGFRGSIHVEVDVCGPLCADNVNGMRRRKAALDARVMRSSLRTPTKIHPLVRVRNRVE